MLTRRGLNFGALAWPLAAAPPMLRTGLASQTAIAGPIRDDRASAGPAWSEVVCRGGALATHAAQ